MATKVGVAVVGFYLCTTTNIFCAGEEAVKCAQQIFGKLETQNRRTLDQISAKCYFYFSRAHEIVHRLDSVRAPLHARLRTATLRNDFEGQAVLINCLLRNYLHYNLYNQVTFL